MADQQIIDVAVPGDARVELKEKEKIDKYQDLAKELRKLWKVKTRVEPLGLVHSDVCGKKNAKSLSGGEYFLTFIDDNTHYIWIYVLKHKDDVFRCFLEWKAQVERSAGRKLKTLHTDNGGEYVSADFEKSLKEEGVRHELIVPKTPEQNGVAERMNRTLVHAG